jgi:hypothetical protein
MKNLIRIAALAGLLLAAVTTPSRAAGSAGLTVKITCNVALSLNLSTGSYDFGLVNASTVVFSSSAVVVTNDSGGRTEDYTIASSTFMAAGGANWNITGSTSAAANQFSLCAKLNSVEALDSAYTSADCFTAPGTPQNMDPSHFAGDQNGKSVLSGATRNLWLRFATPTSLTGGGNVQQSATVTVTANDASLF